jgi:hypothetical protein
LSWLTSLITSGDDLGTTGARTALQIVAMNQIARVVIARATIRFAIRRRLLVIARTV